MSLELRYATVDDLSGIMEIYNDAVLNTTAIWNEVLVDLENRKEWFSARKSINAFKRIREGEVKGNVCFYVFVMQKTRVPRPPFDRRFGQQAFTFEAQYQRLFLLSSPPSSLVHCTD